MIRFENVTKNYPGNPRPALDDINLEVQRGEFVFLVGASGSGKSSCLQLILKEERPSEGTIFVLGNNLGSISHRKVPFFRRDLGVVFQDFRLLPNKTVFQNVAFSLQVIGKSRGFIQEAVPDVLEMVGLGNKSDRLPNELSGGEQQRVAIARAVVNKPQILLADEPTGNLDPATSAGIMKILERINAGGTTVVMATHEAGIVDKMQRRVIELVDGSIVRDEVRGGYGQTAAIPELTPEILLGAQIDQARRDLAEATRQAEDEANRAREAHERATKDAELAGRPRFGAEDPAPSAPVAPARPELSRTESTDVDVEEHLSLAQDLGLRDDESDGDTTVGPVK
ncbi:MAG: cell division ATP-binding protein FtsE [Mycetocola reblochoni]|uniref:Cell division ATP-binding protein FtsE n=2 Tax=Mycetocola reblochoni TaxID=331618 RepID=A0A1R4JAU9_9MICO|nr:cell division ATP-binding protein FtsE [Mycetocola reblochoni]RLP70071.1 cell division ATP-binding protein FtsE [Mycetocola reblochoni]SJN28843.1 Cell division transporter, ATP-binding protein FtsE (TC 3.A.5.1.1) [Mycetocola reblochoni REB411]